MSVQIHCKRRLNLKTERKKERLENNGGGERMGQPSLSPPPI